MVKEENDPIVCIMSARRSIKQAHAWFTHSDYLDEADLMLQRALVLVKELTAEKDALDYELQYGTHSAREEAR